MKKTAFLFVMLIALTSLPVLGGVKVNNPVDQAKIYLDAEDYNAAIPLLQEAAEQGDPDAQNTLGVCYGNGWGVEKSDEKAVKYCRLAADQGYPKGYFNLGLCYYDGKGVAQDYEEAVKYFQLAADQGVVEAQLNLGICYDNGEGVEQDYEEAVKYYQLAADQGDANAQLNLGFCYYAGKGVERDYEKAMEYYRIAADQGSTLALNDIGWMYYKGDGVDQDYDEAVKYFKEAADQGEIYALFNLGMCYQDGTGVEKDIEKAAELYQHALDGGYKPDEEEKGRVEEVLGEEYGTNEESTDEKVSLANPWVDLSAEELLDASGLSFGVPEGAENVIYRYMKSDNLAEMQFTIGNDEFCARIQPADEPVDISGMYYKWENEEDVKIGDCNGTLSQAKNDSEDYVELCQWYDKGLQYSLSAHTTDPDGLDLTAVAEQIYKK